MTENEVWTSVLSELEHLGFYRYTDPALVDEAKLTARESGIAYGPLQHGGGGTDHLSRRVYSADGDWLLSGGAMDFVRGVEPLLGLQDICLPPLEQEWDVGGRLGYVVGVGGEPFWLDGEDDYTDPRRIPMQMVVLRTVAVVDTLLERGGSPDRGYVAFLGEGSQAVFATPAMVEVINSGRVTPAQYKLVSVREELEGYRL